MTAADPAWMEPLFVDGCFAWLHRDPARRDAAGADRASHPVLGVVLCGALAQEEVCTHHGMMLLADRLAVAGMPTLRFDYPGTGDSAADDDGGGDPVLSVPAMVAGIGRAVDALRQQAGVGDVVLCGLRLGAALALHAAAGIDGIAGIALLAPAGSGAAYLRDLGVAVRFSPLAMLDPMPPAGSSQPLNAHGFRLPAAFREELRTLDLAAEAPPPCPLFVAVERGNRRTLRLVEAWRSAGAEVASHDFADYPGFMRDPTVHTVPDATFAATVAWVRARRSTGVVPPLPATAVSIRPMLALADAEEVPLRLGPAGATFAMLCRPRAGPVAPIGMLMLHEGSSHHIGNGGAMVSLARRLARRGVASLRLDLTGMGDSPAPTGTRRPFSDPARLPEVVAGIDVLAPSAPGGVIVAGLCSGAEMAYHVALADDRVVGTLLLNMPAFGWEPAAETGEVAPATRRTVRSYARALRAGGLRRVLRGQVDLVEVGGAIGRRAATDLVRRLRRAIGLAGDPATALVHRQMRLLADRGVRTMLLFSDDDPGLPEIAAHFRGKGTELADFAPARIDVFPAADHHFNGTGIRARYVAYVEAAVDRLIAAHRAGGDG